MSEFSQTTCDACNYEGYETTGPGYYEGPAYSAVYDGWAILSKKRMTKPMTLRTGYVLEARETTDHVHICPECLKDRETVDGFLSWDDRGYDAENYRKARAAFEAADEAAEMAEMEAVDVV